MDKHHAVAGVGGKMEAAGVAYRLRPLTLGDLAEIKAYVVSPLSPTEPGLWLDARRDQSTDRVSSDSVPDTEPFGARNDPHAACRWNEVRESSGNTEITAFMRPHGACLRGERDGELTAASL